MADHILTTQQVLDLMQQCYCLGFEASGEGWNGEHPGNTSEDPVFLGRMHKDLTQQADMPKRTTPKDVTASMLHQATNEQLRAELRVRIWRDREQWANVQITQGDFSTINKVIQAFVSIYQERYDGEHEWREALDEEELSLAELQRIAGRFGLAFSIN